MTFITSTRTIDDKFANNNLKYHVQMNYQHMKGKCENCGNIITGELRTITDASGKKTKFYVGWCPSCFKHRFSDSIEV